MLLSFRRSRGQQALIHEPHYPITPILEAVPEAPKRKAMDFGWVYDRFRRPLFRFISGRVNNESVAEELVQDVFLKAHRFQDSFKPEFEVSTWLWTIARNTMTDWFRKNSETAEVVAGEFDIEQHPCERLCPESNLQAATEQLALRELMHNLSDTQKEILLLRVIHHLSYQEISKKLGLSLSAVKTVLHRSKRALASLLHH